MINLGRHPATEALNVRLIPQPIDRILEVATALLVILMWVGFFVFVNERTLIGIPIIGTIVVGVTHGCAYAPLRYFNLPVRINERNAAIQYLLASRLCRVISIPTALLFCGTLIKDLVNWGTLVLFIATVLLFGVIIIYHIIALRHK